MTAPCWRRATASAAATGAIRRGTRLDMTDGTRQVCDFDPGHVLECGPGAASEPPPGGARLLPGARRRARGRDQYQPRRALATIRRPMAASRIEMRQADQRRARRNLGTAGQGHQSRRARSGAHRRTTRSDMLAFLRTYGDLTPDLLYQGLDAVGLCQLAGCRATRSASSARSDAARHAARRGHVGRHAVRGRSSTSRPPCSSRSAAWTAFRRRLPASSVAVVRLASEVTAIRRSDGGVRIVYRDKRRQAQAVEGAYCLVTIPLKVLDPIEADFSPPVRDRDPQRSITAMRSRSPGRRAGSGRARTTFMAAFPG